MVKIHGVLGVFPDCSSPPVLIASSCSPLANSIILSTDKPWARRSFSKAYSTYALRFPKSFSPRNVAAFIRPADREIFVRSFGGCGVFRPRFWCVMRVTYTHDESDEKRKIGNERISFAIMMCMQYTYETQNGHHLNPEPI